MCEVLALRTTLFTSIEVSPNYWPEVFNPIPCGSSEPTTNPTIQILTSILLVAHGNVGFYVFIS